MLGRDGLSGIVVGTALLLVFAGSGLGARVDGWSRKAALAGGA
jgi:hypothetical protein